jgi:ferredoxin
MARPSGAKTRCSGQWTEARYKSFIKSALRAASKRWAPIQQVLKESSTRFGYFKCAICEQECPVSIILNGKRHKNKIADHIIPVVDPEKGFETWDKVIESMFCEKENLQAVCHACHKEKCGEETAIATERRRREKANG